MESRLYQEWQSAFSNPMPNVIVGLRKNNIRTWRASITGPQDTPYYGGCFIMDIDFPGDYPNSRPIFKMITKIFHMNIASSGEICLDILRSGYKPENNVGYMIGCIPYLLCHPNPNSAFNFEAVGVYRRSVVEYEERAKQETLTHAY